MYSYSISFTVKGHLLKYATVILARVTKGYLPPLSTVAAIIEDGQHLLMVDRSDGLGYSLPGGIMRWDESVYCALARETKEETGYDIEVLQLLNNYSGSNRDPRVNAVCMTYTAKCIGGALASSDEGEPKWIPRGKLFDYKLAFDHREILTDYFAKKMFSGCELVSNTGWLSQIDRPVV